MGLSYPFMPLLLSGFTLVLTVINTMATGRDRVCQEDDKPFASDTSVNPAVNG